MNLINFITLFLILAFIAYVIKQWFAYKKVAVNAKGYAKTTGISYLLLAFMALTGILSLSDKFFNALLNAVLTKIGLPVLDLAQSSEYKWMLFAAFFGLVIAIVFLLKKETKATINNNAQQTTGDMSGTFNAPVNSTHIQNNYLSEKNTTNDNLSKQLVVELQRKNIKIDALQEQLENTPAEEEKLKLSIEINQLQSDLDVYKQEIKTLQEQLEKYSPNNKIVKKTNEILESQGIDKALAYLETIDFNQTLKLAQQHAKALLIKAGIYQLKNQHQKAETAFLQSLQLQRGFDNTISYANYLFAQNKFPESIQQLTLLKGEMSQLSENEKATLIGSLANAYQENNQLKKAELSYNEALEIFQDLAKENPSAYQSDVSTVLNNLGCLYHSNNFLTEAEYAYNEALEIRRGLAKENPSAYQSHVVDTLNNLGLLYHSDNYPKEAERSYNEALDIYRGLAKENPSAYQSNVAKVLNNLANLYRSDNRPKEAERTYNEALDIYRGLAKENPSAYQSYVAGILNNLGLLYHSDNYPKEAERSYNKALDIYRGLAKEIPSAYQNDVAMTLNNLGLLYVSDNCLKEAECAYNETLDIYWSLAKVNPSAYESYVATTLNNLAILYVLDKRLKEAEDTYNQALGIYRGLAKENPSAYGVDLANTLVLGVDLLNQPAENIIEARMVLLKFKGIPKADRLLELIEQLEKSQSEQ